MIKSIKQMNDRNIIRQKAKKERSQIENKELKNQKISETLLKTILGYDKRSVPGKRIRVFIYVSVNDETDTRHVIERLLDDRFQVYCPRVEGKEMNFYRIFSLDELQLGYGGIPEPVKGTPVYPDEEDVVVVPGITFDRNGGRLGYGGGFYDRFLSCHKARTIGICFSEQLRCEALELNSWDVSVDKIITDTETVSVTMKGI